LALSRESAKAEPTPREAIAKVRQRMVDDAHPCFDEKDSIHLTTVADYIASIEHSLEAPPAAERTALKGIQEKIQDRLQAVSMPKGSSTEDTLRWVLSLFDAQERAGATAP
jgi:hypothetical protein